MSDNEGPVEKDVVLDRLARSANVAQFISFGPSEIPIQRFCWVLGVTPNRVFDTVSESIALLLQSSKEQRVNIRSFRVDQTKGNDFIYGLSSVSDVISHVHALSSKGWYTIVNETINVNDGGVSGVALGDAVEFSPDDTPRCVERPGTCRVTRQLASWLFNTVYGVSIDWQRLMARHEFSLHPIRRGVRNEHIVTWESETSSILPKASRPSWPNRFSQLIGDKTFGLLIANFLGLNVPHTTVISRRIAPFVFGSRTGTSEYWLRVAPAIQNPGRFTTTFGWHDPFKILADDERLLSSADSSQVLASVLSQESVPSEYSGGAASTGDGDVIVEGVVGFGSKFMLGQSSNFALPYEVEQAVAKEVKSVEAKLGPVRVEWAFDGTRVWILQLHVGSISGQLDVIVPGSPEVWIDFDVSRGLTELRAFLAQPPTLDYGLRLVGDVGVTSHFGDLLRSRSVPSVIKRG